MFSFSDVLERMYWTKDQHNEIFWSGSQELLGLYYYLVQATAERLGVKPLVVEIGTYTGMCSTVGWAAAVNDLGGRLITIDPQEWGAAEALADNRPHVTYIKAPAQEVLAGWSEMIDVLYIDDGHEEEDVQPQTEGWSQFVKVGGLLAMHDTCPGYAPARAFAWLIAQDNWQTELIIPHTVSNGLCVARRIAR